MSPDEREAPGTSAPQPYARPAPAARLPANAAPALLLARWQRWGIYLSTGLLLLSGVAWLLASDVFDADGPLGNFGQSPFAPWALRVHGIAAYAALVLTGTVLPVHIRLAWLLRRNRVTGSVLAFVIAALAATGLWLYYGPVAGRASVSLSHWIVGLALPAWLIFHRLRGLRLRRNGSP